VGWRLNDARVDDRSAGFVDSQSQRSPLLIDLGQQHLIKACGYPSMDFVADGLAYGRRFRYLNIVDDCTRECVAIKLDTSLPGLRMTQVLHHLHARK
jgi:transposase InsO family protein